MLARRRRLAAFALAAVAAAAALLAPATSTARAQCMPDNLDTAPCCTPVNVNLPVFPPIAQGAKFICFNNCNTQINQNLCVNMTAPRLAATGGGVVCGVYTIIFRITTCGGAMPILWQGTMRAQYSRNWIQAGTAGAPVGVWRFLLNGDFKATTNLTSNPAWASPNVQPGCYSSFNALYMSGYIDYAFDCGNLTWTASWALNHDCDTNHHQAGSPRAGAFHPTRSWTFLGPSAGFVVDPVGTLTASGTSGAEAFRWNDWSTLPAICRAEEPNNGIFVSQGNVCPCGVGSGQYDNTLVSIAGFCGSTMRTQNLPAVQLLQKRIGRWTNPLVFPGTQELAIEMGDMDYNNGCTLLTSLEYFEGVSTIGAPSPMTYGGSPLGQTFVDLASSNRSPTNLSRRVGVPHVWHYIANIDLP